MLHLSIMVLHTMLFLTKKLTLWPKEYDNGLMIVEVLDFYHVLHHSEATGLTEQ
jgi:hypothetical protein